MSSSSSGTRISHVVTSVHIEPARGRPRLRDHVHLCLCDARNGPLPWPWPRSPCRWPPRRPGWPARERSATWSGGPAWSGRTYDGQAAVGLEDRASTFDRVHLVRRNTCCSVAGTGAGARGLGPMFGRRRRNVARAGERDDVAGWSRRTSMVCPLRLGSRNDPLHVGRNPRSSIVSASSSTSARTGTQVVQAAPLGPCRGAGPGYRRRCPRRPSERRSAGRSAGRLTVKHLHRTLNQRRRAGRRRPGSPVPWWGQLPRGPAAGALGPALRSAGSAGRGPNARSFPAGPRGLPYECLPAQRERQGRS